MEANFILTTSSKEVVAKTVESDKNMLMQIDEFFKNIRTSVQFNRDTVLATIRMLEDELTQARTDLLYWDRERWVAIRFV